MIRPRSYSFDDSLSHQIETEDEALEKELSSSIAARKIRECRSGNVFVQESSWLGACCGLFSMSWSKRYARMSADRIFFSENSGSPELNYYVLKGATVGISELVGHNGKHNCLSIVNQGKHLVISLETADELRTWILSLTSAIDSTSKQSGYFNF